LRKETSIIVTRKKGDIWVKVDTGGMRSDASVNRESACLSHLLSKAVEWEMMEESPFKKMKRLFFKEHNQRTFITTAIYTGLRKGEILNLEWKDVDLDRGLIYVRENKQNCLQVKMVNDDLIDLFMKLPVKGEYLFHDEEGKPLRDVKRSFQTALRRAGIEDFRFHDLRHTSCSYLTMRYSHRSPAFQKGSVQLLNGLCQGILKGSEINGEKRPKSQRDQTTTIA
jgi:hypothetical protein